MRSFNRRTFLAGAGAAVAAPVCFNGIDPAFGAVPASGEVDVVIVGAGAAGIAAARRVAAAGRRFALIEASDRIGGRCVTDSRSVGLPFDRGARALYAPDSNPLAQLAAAAGVETYAAPRLPRLRIGRRMAREGEMEDFLAVLFRARRAMAEPARGGGDAAALQRLPKDLPDDWRPTVDFVLGAHATGRDLGALSAVDLARSGDRSRAVFCRGGAGALVAALGQRLPVQLSTPATRIEWLKTLQVETPRGRLRARAVIVTASTSVLAAGKIAFTPELPKSHADALAHLWLGSLDRIALELPDNPLGLGADEALFEKASGARTAALLANVGGSALSVVDVGGAFGAELSTQGEAAMTDFAVSWLSDLFGSNVRNALRRHAVTRWNVAPWVLGAMSAASPGGEGGRKVLMAPLRERVWFAGDAVHETRWGTLGGAWESGTRAAEAALRKIGAIKDDKPEKPARRRKPR
ncbi:MAG TPA: NAD(P)/FAD-dependent oxidoreductase [Pseudolabrys sp.]|nr:NAD(P)/FAD-dependent oxidoreductase [Pseudolabrys sp.]